MNFNKSTSCTISAFLLTAASIFGMEANWDLSPPIDYTFFSSTVRVDGVVREKKDFARENNFNWVEHVIIPKFFLTNSRFAPFFQRPTHPKVTIIDEEKMNKVVREVISWEDAMELFSMEGAGYGVRATRLIPAGTKLAWYAGIATPYSAQNASEYSFVFPVNKEGSIIDVNAKTRRNIAGFFQHFPKSVSAFDFEPGVEVNNVAVANLKYVPLWTESGPITLLETTTDIQPNEVIGHDYGIETWVAAGIAPLLYTKTGDLLRDNYKTNTFEVFVPTEGHIGSMSKDKVVALSCDGGSIAEIASAMRRSPQSPFIVIQTVKISVPGEGEITVPSPITDIADNFGAMIPASRIEAAMSKSPFASVVEIRPYSCEQPDK